MRINPFQQSVPAEVPAKLHPLLSDLALAIEQEFNGPCWLSYEDLEEFGRGRELNGEIFEPGELSQIVEEAFAGKYIVFGSWLGKSRCGWHGREVKFERRSHK